MESRIACSRFLRPVRIGFHAVTSEHEDETDEDDDGDDDGTGIEIFGQAGVRFTSMPARLPAAEGGGRRECEKLAASAIPARDARCAGAFHELRIEA